MYRKILTTSLQHNKPEQQTEQQNIWVPAVAGGANTPAFRAQSYL
jgi:hypothetical protein